MKEHDSITLTIDGQSVTGRSTDTILSTARSHGIFIPSLCFFEGLTPAGSCRLCVVEIEGSSKLSPDCTTPIGEGMRVTTQSSRLSRYRKAIIELLFSERTHVCAVCVANGSCELQHLAQVLGVDHVSYPGIGPALPLDASHDRFVLDPNRCILCTRCVRVCAEIEGAHTWDVKNRGIHSQIIADFDIPWGQSTTCTGCGKCVRVCPTGALFSKETSRAATVATPFNLVRLLTHRAEGHQ
jgi:bidirectional [NiFe] hydrogenase diaphorase subunit